MRKRIFIFMVIVISMLILANTVFAKTQKPNPIEEERTGPYFLVEGDKDVEGFPLLETKVNVNIAGVIAEIELTQVYKNDGKKTIEAVYIFPLGTKSAIHAMQMKIGNRLIDAEIKEKGEARQIYDDAKEDGKVASLLVQHRPNVFQMNVANIMPGDIVQVTVKYTENLVPEDGVYNFAFPTVVGPRFTGEVAKKDLKGKDEWMSSPYTKEGKLPSYDFDIKVNLNTGLPLGEVSVNTHKVDIIKNSPASAMINLSKDDKKRGNKDFILKYSLQGRKIESGLLLYPGKDENYFLLMVEPPKQVDLKMVPPREYVFIVDVSGSMNGFPLDVSKALVKDILNGLRKKDYFNIIFFAGGSKTLAEKPLKATKTNIKKAIDMLNAQRGGGGTRITAAIQKAIALKKKKGMSRIVVIATDGYVGVEKKTFDLIRDNMSEANVFTFGIGRGVNRYLIEGMARVGKGEPFVVTDKGDAEEAAAKFIEYVKYPLLTDIKVKFQGFNGYEIEPVEMPDLFALRPLVLFGKYRRAYGTIIITGNTADGPYKKVIEVRKEFEDKKNMAIKYLWAREKIARLGDYSKVGVEVKKEITDLGLKYHLMTEYTSFVAVDKIIRETGEIVTVKQPLPLPEGVSNYAVGITITDPVTGTFGGTLNQNAIESRNLMASGFSAEYGEPISRIVDVVDEEGKVKQSTGKIKKMHITSGVVPAGVALSDIEKVIYAQIRTELEKKFDTLKVTKITVEFIVENGKVKDFKVLSSKGEKFKDSEFENIFEKLKFPKIIKGKIKLVIKYR